MLDQHVDKIKKKGCNNGIDRVAKNKVATRCHGGEVSWWQGVTVASYHDGCRER